MILENVCIDPLYSVSTYNLISIDDRVHVTFEFFFQSIFKIDQKTETEKIWLEKYKTL